MTFRVQGLEAGEFSHLFGLTDAELSRVGARRYVVDAKPGFPDRVEVRDLEIGESAISLNYEHQPAATPYRSAHAIFVREGADRALDLIGTIPEALRVRPISLRAFTATGEMLHADLAAGGELEPLVETFLADPDVAYLHAHYAKRDCSAALITRS